MRKNFVLLLLLVCVLALGPSLAAQTASGDSGGPPNIIQIFREDVKPGKAVAHAKLEAGWPAAFRKAKSPWYYLAATTMTGPTEAWFISPYSSLGDWEKANKDSESNKALQSELDRLSAADGENINSGRSMVAAYIPELSYRPNVNIGEYRYFMVETVRVKLGHGNEFGELRKAVNAAHEKANLDEHMLVYSVISGAPQGTFLVFQPAKSLTESDEAAKTHGEGSAYQAAYGDAGRKMARDFNLNDALLVQRDWLSFSPAMSYVSEKTIATAPDYWSPKPVMAKSAAPAKKAAGAEAK